MVGVTSDEVMVKLVVGFKNQRLRTSTIGKP